MPDKAAASAPRAPRWRLRGTAACLWDWIRTVEQVQAKELETRRQGNNQRPRVSCERQRIRAGEAGGQGENGKSGQTQRDSQRSRRRAGTCGSRRKRATRNEMAERESRGQSGHGWPLRGRISRSNTSTATEDHTSTISRTKRRHGQQKQSWRIDAFANPGAKVKPGMFAPNVDN